MTTDLVQSIGRGAGASVIAATIERHITEGRLAPAEQLPPVRRLAAALSVSPATVAAAYRALKQRGLVVGERARGTAVAPQPPVRVKRIAPLPPGVRDLADGNPDPKLLPSLRDAIRRLAPEHRLYGHAPKADELVESAKDEFTADGLRGEITVTGGALDAVERALQTELRPGDRVVVEDPSWPRITDLVYALGFVAQPVSVDNRGLDPAAFERALRAGARAVIATPRGQNPTAVAVDPRRGRELRAVVAGHPGVLVIEDDYVSRVGGAPYVSLHDRAGRWLVVRSLSKWLGPDLRVAIAVGDELTISRIEGRQRLGSGWVSHILQRTAAKLLNDPATAKLLGRAEQIYAKRRAALVTALAEYGIAATGRSGLGVWVPLRDEATATRELLVQGWAVAAGERYRFESPPGLRITTAALEPRDSRRLAAAIAGLAAAPSATYTA